MIIPDAMQAIQRLCNGCSICVDTGTRRAKKDGDKHERLFAVAVRRWAPYFTDAERAALALTEAVTRLSDRADPVPDEIWDEAPRYFDDPASNGLNVTTRQVAGTWGPR